MDDGAEFIKMKNLEVKLLVAEYYYWEMNESYRNR